MWSSSLGRAILKRSRHDGPPQRMLALAAKLIQTHWQPRAVRLENHTLLLWLIFHFLLFSVFLCLCGKSFLPQANVGSSGAVGEEF
jgi:hypothetical protein